MPLLLLIVKIFRIVKTKAEKKKKQKQTNKVRSRCGPRSYFSFCGRGADANKQATTTSLTM